MVFSKKLLVIIDPLFKDDALCDYFNKFDYELLILDKVSEIHDLALNPTAILLNTPDLKLIKELVHYYFIPIIAINDHADENTCVSMLEAGVDDFLVKPLHPRELHARINAISRRVQRLSSNLKQEKNIFVFGDWRLYPASRQLFNKNEELSLSAGEYDLLLAFIRQPQQILSRDFLLQASKHSNLLALERRIDVQISRLRQKIENKDKAPALIKTIRNGGYLFTANVRFINEEAYEHCSDRKKKPILDPE